MGDRDALIDELSAALQRFETTAEPGPLPALFHDDGEALSLGPTEAAQGCGRNG